MKIRYHEVTVVFILHTHIIPDRPEIIPEMQEAGRPDPAHYNLFLAAILHFINPSLNDLANSYF